MSGNASLYALIAEAAAAAGDKPFLVEGVTARLRYAELDAQVARRTAALAESGARPGDRILVQVEKSVENVLLYLASLRAGLVYVPLNTAYTPAELDYFIADAEPSAIVCDPAKKSAIASLKREAALLTLDASGHGSFAEAVAATAAGRGEIVARESGDLAAILYTSGTTGRSKGAMLSHENLSSNALVLKECWR